MPDDEFYFGDFLFQFGPIFIGIIFIFVIGSILFTIFKGIGQWHKNEQSPRLSVPAIIKAKRTDVSRGSNNDNNSLSSSTYTTYYVTFEFESGDRTEFHVSGKEYGLLSENDTGILNFQGTRFLGFERNSINQENT
ncbi:DUF2500 domain-containing protein [Niallia taxi]|uniref:DUF2500 domain-containing protein n=1 Tax=Niallia taxi TaxID=2499688 RepID=UPI0023A99012|nr:DUF2500 domain-containing protein [Niallia taxi]MDE5053323.1 DUF2500 domain-containing protein [Niallia taxi]WOD61324.1 DUF2500 domain-containing protein [Niallia taxi]